MELLYNRLIQFTYMDIMVSWICIWREILIQIIISQSYKALKNQEKEAKVKLQYNTSPSHCDI